MSLCYRQWTLIPASGRWKSLMKIMIRLLLHLTTYSSILFEWNLVKKCHHKRSNARWTLYDSRLEGRWHFCTSMIPSCFQSTQMKSSITYVRSSAYLATLGNTGVGKCELLTICIDRLGHVTKPRCLPASSYKIDVICILQTRRCLIIQSYALFSASAVFSTSSYRSLHRLGLHTTETWEETCSTYTWNYQARSLTP